MVRYVGQILAVLSLIMLLGTVFSPVTLAWGPPGSDGWYLGPDGFYHQGTSWWPQGQPYGNPGCYGPSYPTYQHPYPGYDQYQYQGYYVQQYAAPAPQPYFQAPAPQCRIDAYYSCQQPTLVDRFNMPWGTFGTYDNWVREFYAVHGRCPNDQDVCDFWYSQRYAATHCGCSPW
jgi:hypothetical protein